MHLIFSVARRVCLGAPLWWPTRAPCPSWPACRSSQPLFCRARPAARQQCPQPPPAAPSTHPAFLRCCSSTRSPSTGRPLSSWSMQTINLYSFLKVRLPSVECPESLDFWIGKLGTSLLVFWARELIFACMLQWLLQAVLVNMVSNSLSECLVFSENCQKMAQI